MSPKKPKDEGSGQPAAQPVDGADPSRLAFTSAIVAALKDLDTRKAPSSAELGQRAYAKLQYDLPVGSGHGGGDERYWACTAAVLWRRRGLTPYRLA